MELVVASDVGGVLWLVLIAVYFLPSLVAMWRKVSSIGSVVVINVFLGWTLLGWVVALALAARSAPSRSGVTPEA